MHVSEEPPTRPRPRPRPRPVEPFRELATPPEGTPLPLMRERPIETIADLGRELRIVRRELVLLRSAPPPALPVTVEALPSSVPPPPRPSRPARVAAGAWKGTQWLGVVTLALTIAAQVAALLKPGLVGPIERARDAVETLAK